MSSCADNLLTLSRLNLVTLKSESCIIFILTQDVTQWPEMRSVPRKHQLGVASISKVELIYLAVLKCILIKFCVQLFFSTLEISCYIGNYIPDLMERI